MPRKAPTIKAIARSLGHVQTHILRHAVTMENHVPEPPQYLDAHGQPQGHLVYLLATEGPWRSLRSLERRGLVYYHHSDYTANGLVYYYYLTQNGRHVAKALGLDVARCCYCHP